MNFIRCILEKCALLFFLISLINCQDVSLSNDYSVSYPSHERLAVKLTGGFVRLWLVDGQLLATSLSIKFTILYKINIANWICSTHASTISTSLSHSIYLITLVLRLMWANLCLIIFNTMLILLEFTYLSSFLIFCESSYYHIPISFTTLYLVSFGCRRSNSKIYIPQFEVVSKGSCSWLSIGFLCFFQRFPLLSIEWYHDLLQFGVVCFICQSSATGSF